MDTDPLRIGRIANGRRAYAFDITDLSLLRHPTAKRNSQPYNKTRKFTISGMISGQISGMTSIYFIGYDIRSDIGYDICILYQV